MELCSELQKDNLSNDIMSNDIMSNDKMSNDILSNDKMSNGSRLSLNCQCLTVGGLCFIIFCYWLFANKVSPLLSIC
jgi:hypothetical protein